MQRITGYGSTGRRELSLADFEERFLEACEAHRAQGRALAFAFILFDRGNPLVRRVLGTEEYWDALDERSGRALTVFSFDVRPPDRAYRPVGRELRALTSVAVPSWSRADETLRRYFDGVENQALPCVLFFQVADGAITDSFGVHLKGADVEAAYQALDGVIGAAADAVAGVHDENTQNVAEIFNLIRAGVGERQAVGRALAIWRIARPVGEVGALLELVRHLF